MPINSRAKGCDYELEVAEYYSLWWFGVKKALRRTPMSGGWGKTIATGDIIAEIEPWPFSVECKNSKSWEFRNDLFHPSLGVIGEYWDQCVTAAEKEDGKIPVLNFHGLRTRHYMMYRLDDISWPHPHAGEELTSVPHIRVRDHQGKDCVITDFTKNFLKLDPRWLMKNNRLRSEHSSSEYLEKYEHALTEAQQKFGSKPSKNS